MTYRFTWKDRALFDRSKRAAQLGINETLAICVQIAAPLTPFLWGFLRRSIRFEPAVIRGEKIFGRWGSFDIGYALQNELHHRTKSRFLKKASDRAYPTLTRRISRQFKGLP